MKLDHLSDTSVDLPESTAEEIKLMRDVADDSYDLLRGFLALLQSDTSTSPLKLFSKYSEKITERSRVNISIISHGTPRTLSAATVRQLFFIFRESLNNIEKHSRASEGRVEFRWGKDSFEMTISDNGHGFDSTASKSDGHYGLKFMRERAEQIHGLLDIHSSPDTGTKVILRVPLENGY
jgi:nitrate/nitrite-specific signal transduction histidine kinase